MNHATCLILMGIPATGKSTFFQERLVDTHVRVSLDMLRTHPREAHLVEACLETGIPFAVDNTNPARADRQRYIPHAKARGFRIVGYYFSSRVEEALRRNATRTGKGRIPDAGVLASAARLETPSLAEGFDELYHVTLGASGFTVSTWRDEV